MPGGEYQFFSWTRTGIGALLGGQSRTVALDLGPAGSVSKPVAPYSASQITALDPGAFLRTVPPPGTSDFEPNLFASIELAHPALPWLASGPPDANGRTLPWLVLIVVEEQPGVALVPGRANGTMLAIDPPAVPSRELPDLTQSWAWAHAQMIGTENTAIDVAGLARAGVDARGRLIAPRKLEPRKSYIACVVPALASGVAAALGGPAGGAGPGWTGTEATLRLPVYHSWRFSTGPGGDFASLVKLLTAEKLDASVGHRTIDASTPGWGIPATPGTTIELSGALRSSDWTPTAASASAQALGSAIAAEIDQAAAPLPGHEPVLAPPNYGSAASRVEGVSQAPAWQRDLNSDISQRMAAGLGAAVVRANLDAYADAAWSAAGDAEAANRWIRQAQLAAVVTQQLVAKHVTPLADDGEVLAIARPLLARVRAPAQPLTVAASIEASAMPDAALAPALRRLGRPGGLLARGAAVVRTGALTRAIDANKVVVVPPRALPAGAAGFDEIAHGRDAPQLAIATATAVDHARDSWKASAEHATAEHATARARVVSDAKPVTRVPDGEGAWTPIPISQLTQRDPIAIDEFAAAARRHQAYIVGKLEKIPDRTLPPLGDVHAARPLEAVRSQIEAQWSPQLGIIPLLGSRIGNVNASVLAGLQTFQLIQVTPVLEQPLVRPLQALSPTYVMPGVETILANRVSLAVTGPEFVRACLVGANEELGRALLWRGLPTALGHTWLRTFWGRTTLSPTGVPVGQPDIPAIESWPPAGPDPTPASLVLLVRGEVLRRYPNALVYAIAARWQGRYRLVGEGAPLAPVFAATLANDIAMFGFDLSPDAARGHDAPPADPGWYFVIAEHPHEPHFGLAASPQPGDLAWNDLQPGDLAGSYVRVDGPLAGTNPAWGTDAAHMATLTLRHTIRVARHASTLMV